MMPYRLQDDAANSTASSISAMSYTIKTPEAKSKYDRVKMTSCINVYTFLYIGTFMCVGVCIHVFNIQTEYIHESRLLGPGSTTYIYIYIVQRCSPPPPPTPWYPPSPLWFPVVWVPPCPSPLWLRSAAPPFHGYCWLGVWRPVAKGLDFRM